jgi:hypothetical protein
MIRYDQRAETAPPGVYDQLRAIDWILARLRLLLCRFPERAADLRPRVDAALDERLRLMRLRDGSRPFPRNTHRA